MPCSRHRRANSLQCCRRDGAPGRCGDAAAVLARTAPPPTLPAASRDRARALIQYPGGVGRLDPARSACVPVHQVAESSTRLRSIEGLLVRDKGSRQRPALIGADVYFQLIVLNARLMSSGSLTSKEQSSSTVSQPDVLVGAAPEVPADEAQRRLGHPGSISVQADDVPDGREHRPLVHKLLDPLQCRPTSLSIALRRLLLDEPLDVGVAAVRVE